MALDPDECRDLLHAGGTILGTSRTNPFATDGGPDRALAALERPRHRRRRGHRRRRHPGRGRRVWVALGVAGGGGAQDHRQRPVGDRGDLRLRHRGPDRHRGHRPAPDHRRVPPPGHRVRGDGAPRRLDRHLCRASPAARPRSWCPRSPSTSTRCAPRLTPAPRAGPVLVDRGGRRGRACRRDGPDADVGPAGHLAPSPSTSSATPAWAASGPGWPRRSSGRTGYESRVTTLGHIQRGGTPTAYRPGAGHPLRGGGGRGGPRRATSAPWWPSRPGGSSGCRWPRPSAGPKTLDLDLLTDVAGPFLGLTAGVGPGPAGQRRPTRPPGAARPPARGSRC